MAEENKNIPVENDENNTVDEPKNETQPDTGTESPDTPADNAAADNTAASQGRSEQSTPPPPPEDDEAFEDMDGRLERLGGEPAPVITPEEFARLQKAGQVHIDSRGRVRTASRSGPNAGVSLRKRRAWYDR